VIDSKNFERDVKMTVSELELKVKELEEELEESEYGGYQYDVAMGDLEYYWGMLKKMKKN
jgi:hypothetical protein